MILMTSSSQRSLLRLVWFGCRSESLAASFHSQVSDGRRDEIVAVCGNFATERKQSWPAQLTAMAAAADAGRGSASSGAERRVIAPSPERARALAESCALTALSYATRRR